MSTSCLTHMTVARTFVNADAGSIYIREGETLKFSYTQNDTFQKQLAPDRSSSFNIHGTDQQCIARRLCCQYGNHAEHSPMSYELSMLFPMHSTADTMN